MLKIKQLAVELQRFEIKVQVETEADLETKPKWPTKVLNSGIDLRENMGDGYTSDYVPPPRSATKRKRNTTAAVSQEFIEESDDEDNFDGEAIPGAKTSRRKSKIASASAAASDTPQPPPPDKRKSTGGRGGPQKPKPKPKPAGKKTTKAGSEATMRRRSSAAAREAVADADED
jgi:hypothetical protein